MTNKHGILWEKCLRGKWNPEQAFEHTEEDLTIGIAFRCNDGIVLAADRLRMRGYFGSHVTKVRSFKPRRNFVGAMVGAGDSGYIDVAFTRLNAVLTDGMSLANARTAIDHELLKLHEERIRRGIKHDELEFTLLLALWSRNGGFELFSGGSNTPVHVVDRIYTSIGVGRDLADILVKTFNPLKRPLSCQGAAIISAVTIKFVKLLVPGCGGGTNIVAVMKDGLATPKSAKGRRAIEGHFLEFFATAHQRFVEQHRKDPFLVRRFPREEKEGARVTS
jgi:hypothetical protein